jgi:crotonobetainyl-CoA:carnitine CoA-transferase CaiB-like acyl-CoA transferase
MLQSDRYWPNLVETIGRPDLATDPRFVDAAARAANKAECVHVLDEIFAGHTYEEWKEILADVEGVWAGVQTLGEVIRDPQVAANGYVADLADAGGRAFKLVTTPIQFGETPGEPQRAPEHGEHTDEVLQAVGFDMEELIDLKVRGAIL